MDVSDEIFKVHAQAEKREAWNRSADASATHGQCRGARVKPCSRMVAGRWIKNLLAESGFLLVGLLLLGGMLVQAQQTDGPRRTGIGISNETTTTQQRIESEPWWPTISTATLDAYAGSERCVRCHADESSSESLTSMQRAASQAADANLLRELSLAREGQGTTFSYAPLTYSVSAAGPAVEYSVAEDTAKVTQRLDWVMGAGDLGQTFVYQRDDQWYQSRLSAYARPPKLDATTGLRVEAIADLTEALGKRLSPDEVRHCFSCHTVHATTSRGFNPLHAEAGLGCEACHGPGATHGKKMEEPRTGPLGKGDLSIFNPAKLAPANSIDFCGACHRTSGDVTESSNTTNDASVVRFQPYRLEKSRCWRETQDARLACVSCHDPHQPLNRTDASYDKQCLGCHKAGSVGEHVGKICTTGAQVRCVSCHMPKVEVASMHGEFTDHWIRVVKAGERFEP